MLIHTGCITAVTLKNYKKRCNVYWDLNNKRSLVNVASSKNAILLIELSDAITSITNFRIDGSKKYLPLLSFISCRNLLNKIHLSCIEDIKNNEFEYLSKNRFHNKFSYSNNEISQLEYPSLDIHILENDNTFLQLIEASIKFKYCSIIIFKAYDEMMKKYIYEIGIIIDKYSLLWLGSTYKLYELYFSKWISDIVSDIILNNKNKSKSDISHILRFISNLF